MTDLEFGVTPPPARSAERYAYVGRHPRCGHIRFLRSDNSPNAVGEFVRMGVAGLELERIPLARATTEGIGECGRCRPPEQRGLGL